MTSLIATSAPPRSRDTGGRGTRRCVSDSSAGGLSDPDAASVLVKGATVTLFLLFAACAPKHPDLSLRRQATKANRELEDATPAASGDERYAVPSANAVAATNNALLATCPVAEVSDETVSTDWTWSGSPSVDSESEFYDQRHVRTVATRELQGARRVRRERGAGSGRRSASSSGAPRPSTSLSSSRCPSGPTSPSAATARTRRAATGPSSESSSG